MLLLFVIVALLFVVMVCRLFVTLIALLLLFVLVDPGSGADAGKRGIFQKSGSIPGIIDRRTFVPLIF